jgi:protein-tyrosine sulfotransferase
MADRKYIAIRFLRPDFAARRLMSLPVFDERAYAGVDLSPEEENNLRAVAESAARPFEKRRLLFVYGAMPRSGTNFLFEVLLRHPLFARPGIGFDELGVLADPAVFEEPRRVIGSFHPPSGAAFARLEWMAFALAGLRNRLLSLAAEDTVTVVKEPHAYHLELLPVMFPCDRCIMLLRNARYIVDSYFRTFAGRRFGRTFEDVCLETAAALAKVLDFLDRTPRQFVHPVRYEDVALRRESVMTAILDWLGEEARPQDMLELDNIPVLGSSTHSRDANGAVSWAPRAVDANFDPVSRPLEWTRTQEEVFTKTCAEVNRRAGY